MTRTSAMASSLGQAAAHADRAKRAASGAAGAGPDSRRSSPVIAEDCPDVCCPAAGSVLVAMAAHLLAQPVGNPRGEFRDLDGVDPARPPPGYRVLLALPAGPAAPHHSPLSPPHGLPHAMADAQ